jgi:hypothetical protein
MRPVLKVSENGVRAVNLTIEDISQLAHRFSPHRNIMLFRDFLPKGYNLTTLSSVSDALKESNLLVKICIGTIITLYDDLADHPKLRNPSLLRDLYQLPFDRRLTCESRNHPLYVALAELWDTAFSHMATFPHYHLLRPAFEFDVQQFFNANRYAEMVTDLPAFFNTRESRNYMHHNMGIILVGTIDLMCSPYVDTKLIGSARALFFEAQKAARLMNMIATVDREIKEGDVTNELVFMPDREQAVLSIQDEMNEIFASIRTQNSTSFSVPQYVQGMEALFELHKSLRGVI